MPSPLKMRKQSDGVAPSPNLLFPELKDVPADVSKVPALCQPKLRDFLDLLAWMHNDDLKLFGQAEPKIEHTSRVHRSPLIPMPEEGFTWNRNELVEAFEKNQIFTLCFHVHDNAKGCDTARFVFDKLVQAGKLLPQAWYHGQWLYFLPVLCEARKDFPAKGECTCEKLWSSPEVRGKGLGRSIVQNLGVTKLSEMRTATKGFWEKVLGENAISGVPEY